MNIGSLRPLLTLGLTAFVVVGQAATFTVSTSSPDGLGSFSQAIRDANASTNPVATIEFNIAGDGPHYITPPVGGFPLVTKDNLTIDGYSQPGSAVNTAPITETNNAVIKIALDARSPNNNFRDMAYVWYGTFTTSDPPIDNSSMAGSPAGTSPERGGYGEANLIPYQPGEVAILGIYRATNVTIQGLALLGNNDGVEYAIAVAIDYGLDSTVKDRWTYDEGSCRGFHLSGCWIGFDPATGNAHLSGAAVAAARHRDRPGGLRPELPNVEDMVIGVKNGGRTARGQFNVLAALGLTILAEGTRCKISGNQFLGSADAEIGGYDDTRVPSLIYGTDGDGVNDAEEGNLLPATTIALYNTSNQVIQIAGNTFGLDRDGSRPNAGRFAVDLFRFDQRTKVVFGSNMDGQNDDLEANTLYDTLGIGVNANAPDQDAWISLRRNNLINNSASLPMDEATGHNLYANWMSSPFTPAITAVTESSLSGTCGVPLPGVKRVVIDIYEADASAIPQGRRYLGSFQDNTAEDSDPTLAAFAFDTTALGIHSGMSITLNATYLTGDGSPMINSISRNGGNTTLNFSGGTGPFSVFRSSTVAGPYTNFASADSSPAVFADPNLTSFYKLAYAATAGMGAQTSPFAMSVTVP